MMRPVRVVRARATGVAILRKLYTDEGTLGAWPGYLGRQNRARPELTSASETTNPRLLRIQPTALNAAASGMA
jgi:hypothetical protein